MLFAVRDFYHGPVTDLHSRSPVSALARHGAYLWCRTESGATDVSCCSSCDRQSEGR